MDSPQAQKMVQETFVQKTSAQPQDYSAGHYLQVQPEVLQLQQIVQASAF
jgi:hypothetical protein